MLIKILFSLILIFSFFGVTISAQPVPVTKRVSLGIVNGKATSLPKPEYPAAALAVRASGAVNVQVTIDEEGKVISATAVSGHPLLRQPAEKAARQSTFTPTSLSGQLVKVTGVIVYNFVPDQTNEEKLRMMGLGAFLSVSRFLDLDDDWESVVKDLEPEFSQISVELEPLLRSVNKNTNKEKKAQIINQAINLIEKNLQNSDVWQFHFGKYFGELLIEAKPSSENNNQRFNAPAIKLRLLKIREFINTAPANFPTDVLNKFKEIDKFADRQDLDSEDTKSQLISLIVETLNTIEPN